MFKSLTIVRAQKIIGVANTLNALSPPSRDGMDYGSRTWEDRQAYETQRRPLIELLCALDHDALVEVRALIDLGRGTAHNFEEAVEYARTHSDAGDVSYIAALRPLPKYLRAGLKKLRAENLNQAG